VVEENPVKNKDNKTNGEEKHTAPCGSPIGAKYAA
jgi:hypothetical protein